MVKRSSEMPPLLVPRDAAQSKPSRVILRTRGEHQAAATPAPAAAAGRASGTAGGVLVIPRGIPKRHSSPAQV